MKQTNKFVILSFLLPTISLANEQICIDSINFSYSAHIWSRKKEELVRKNSRLTEQNIILNITNNENPNITPISDSDAQEGLGIKGNWYLGGVDGTTGPALITKKNGFTFYEATGTCSITYKNGISGTGLCYSARIIGKSSDIEINAGPITFEESKKSTNIYKTKSVNEFRKIIYSATTGCKKKL
ncbi:hypothetical protein [Vogesella sp. LIG4]|uniref:hypothetical protein n=1 Tax=Vogesella sp. LIG4 TaxID=1192162 RepID=UPI0012FD29B8|nr:hypothetical protein [Vogesella sp. LIG4]